MALLKRLYRTRTTRLHEDYQKYVIEEKRKGRKPLSFKLWSGGVKTVKKAKLRRRVKKQPTSKSATVRTKAIKGGLKRAGISDISATRKAREAARRK